MNLKKFFSYMLYLFIIVVPLVPYKLKISFLPLSADFVLGGLIILLGIYILLRKFSKGEDLFSIFKMDMSLKFFTALILAFTVLSLASVSYSINKGAAISEFIRFFEYVLLFYFVILLIEEEQIETSLKLFYGVFIIASLIGVIQFVFGLSIFKDSTAFGRGRVFGTFVNPNYWGAAVNLVIFFPLILLFEKKGKSRYVNFGVYLLFLFNLIFSFTRGSWLGFAVGLVIIFIMKYKKALLSLPFIAILGLVLPFTRGRILSIFDVTYSTNNIRIKLWETGIRMFKEHFWLGVGNGNYLTRYHEYITKYPELYADKDLWTVHNSYIKMFAELGIFGGILFILIYLMLAYFAYRVYKGRREAQNIRALAMLGFWGAYLFQNFFNNLIFIPQLNVLVWLITAILYKKYLLDKQEAKL